MLPLQFLPFDNRHVRTLVTFRLKQVQTIKFALRRHSKRILYTERTEQVLSERYPDPEAEPLTFEEFQHVYRSVLSNSEDMVQIISNEYV